MFSGSDDETPAVLAAPPSDEETFDLLNPAPKSKAKKNKKAKQQTLDDDDDAQVDTPPAGEHLDSLLRTPRRIRSWSAFAHMSCLSISLAASLCLVSPIDDGSCL